MPTSSSHHRRLPSVAPPCKDHQDYLEEALTTARTLADNLEYLARLHGRPDKVGQSDPALLAAVFSGLKLQAGRVVNFLEECAT